MSKFDREPVNQIHVTKVGRVYPYDGVSISYDTAIRRLTVHDSKSGDVSFLDATPGETAYGEPQGTEFIIR